MSASSTVQALLKDYNLEIDDVRWYVSTQMAAELFELQAEPKKLIRQIWSGELESRLYRLEERFLENLQHDLERNTLDETRLREIMQEMVVAKRRRSR